MNRVKKRNNWQSERIFQIPKKEQTNFFVPCRRKWKAEFQVFRTSFCDSKTFHFFPIHSNSFILFINNFQLLSHFEHLSQHTLHSLSFSSPFIAAAAGAFERSELNVCANSVKQKEEEKYKTITKEENYEKTKTEWRNVTEEKVKKQALASHRQSEQKINETNAKRIKEKLKKIERKRIMNNMKIKL